MKYYKNFFSILNTFNNTKWWMYIPFICFNILFFSKWLIETKSITEYVNKMKFYIFIMFLTVIDFFIIMFLIIYYIFDFNIIQ
jgi:uncharacterized membrane protein